MSKRSFASDNNAGVHPEIIKAIKAANDGHVIAYGGDPITARAVKLFQKHFGQRHRGLLCFRRHRRERSRPESNYEVVSRDHLRGDGARAL